MCGLFTIALGLNGGARCIAREGRRPPKQRRISMNKVRLVFCLCALILVIPLYGEETKSEDLETSKEKPKKGKKKQNEKIDESELTLEKILEMGVDEDSYKSSKTCIDHRRIRSYEVLNRRNLVLEMRDGTKYLITTKSNCHGMSKHATLSTHQRSSMGFCRGDTMRWGNTEFGSMTWSAPCWVDEFEPISDYQITRLKEAIKTGRVK